jgi:phage host-nuclease inhibitor protein Gam
VSTVDGEAAAAAWLAVGDAEREVVRVGETEAAEVEATGEEAEYARRRSAESERASHTDKMRGVCTAARDSVRQLGKVRQRTQASYGQFKYKRAMYLLRPSESVCMK